MESNRADGGGNRGRGRGGRGGGGNRGGRSNQHQPDEVYGGGGRGYYPPQGRGGDNVARGGYQNQSNRSDGGYAFYQNQNQSNPSGGRGNYQNDLPAYETGGGYHNNRGGGGYQQSRGGGGASGGYQQSRGGGGRGQNQGRGWGNESNQGGGGNFQAQSGGRGWGNNRGGYQARPQGQPGYTPPPQQQTAVATKQWGPPSSSSGPVAPQQQPSADVLAATISEKLHLGSSADGANKKQLQPIKRPDQGGRLAIRSVRLLVNHFPVHFDPQKTILHYDVDIKPVADPNSKGPVKKPVRKSDLRLIKDKLFSDVSQFGEFMTAYDGEKNIFSAVSLPTGQFKVDIGDGEDVKSGSYMFTIKCVNELKLSKLRDYLRGEVSNIPRDILMGMDLVMKENPFRKRISVGRGFYSANYQKGDDLRGGVAAYRGFQSSLKPTSQGLVLCLDYSTLAFRKPMPVIDYLVEHIPNFQLADFERFKKFVVSALKGLKVRVTHRLTKQKYTITGLAPENTRDSYFQLDDPDGKNPPQNVSLVQYFKDKWGKDIMHLNIPCLDVGRNNRSNKVPMEFCVLVEGQRFDKEALDKNRALLLKNLTLVRPEVRKKTIDDMVAATDGPIGAVSKNFTIEVDLSMTQVSGRVIGAPELKIGGSRPVRVDGEKCQWNLVRKSVREGKSLDRWAVIDFTLGDRFPLDANGFIPRLINRSRDLGMHMEEPLCYRQARMIELSSHSRLEKLLKSVVEESAATDSRGKLQMIVCIMTKKDPGYKTLKLISETRVGIVTQVCLSPAANKGQDQYFANLCLKINAKLGGNNFELSGKLPHFKPGDHVMFIGADVNHPHPGPLNASSPSIAAVVGTVNWPEANRYAARVSPQAHRVEKILNFGSICRDLINTYVELNKVRPNKIVVFRDGVSEGQFEMVLGEELIDLKRAVCDDNYQPQITIIVAQKRHQTRLFLENPRDGGATGNVPPGTVVDTKIVHPYDFDFYLASHYGGIGTSKPTHYHVLWDENLFTSDELQKLIYDMCFTFARCTKPVSLVPPVYYADLVAYRGRYFQEAMSDGRAVSDSVGFDASLYKLHPDLQNMMFFV